MYHSVSIIVPAYNEERYIVKHIYEIRDYMRKLELSSFEIIVVNDGSKDKTLELIRELERDMSELRVVDNGVNRGKGFTVKHGVSYATGDLIFFTDSDLSTPVIEIGKFIQIMNHSNCDVLIGTRSLKHGANLVKKQPFYRVFMGKVFSILTNTIVPLNGIEDTQCGFKCFKKEAAMKLFQEQTMERFSFDVEILYLARLYHFGIQEEPVTWINDEISTVDPIKDSYRMFKDLWTIRFRHKGKGGL